MRATFMVMISQDFDGKAAVPHFDAYVQIWQDDKHVLDIDVIPDVMPGPFQANEDTRIEGWASQMSRELSRMVGDTFVKSVESGDLTPMSCCKLVTEVTPDAP